MTFICNCTPAVAARKATAAFMGEFKKWFAASRAADSLSPKEWDEVESKIFQVALTAGQRTADVINDRVDWRLSAEGARYWVEKHSLVASGTS